MSSAGVFFIILGLVALALPSAQEGTLLWKINPEHAIHMMDLVGIFAAALGVILTWLGGKLWQRQINL